MSPRAAWRLESLGFTDVYDYAGGKTDWMGAGMPTEGEATPPPGAGTVARTSVPTCRLDDDVAQVRERDDVREAGVCIVTTDDGIVLGRLRHKQLGSEASARVADVMEEGPTTVRFDEPLVELIGRMQKGNVDTILVTAASGKLIGITQRSDGEELLQRLHASHEHAHH